MVTTRSYLASAVAAATLVGLAACGGGGGGGGGANNPGGGVTGVSTPAVAIVATGAGALTLHPSVDSRFAFAMETPLRVTETAGGTADWNFARISVFLNGKEIERFELGADVIKSYGYNRISANQNQVVRVFFRMNSQDFDRLDITLGFSDLKDARQFTVAVPFNSFSDVNLSLTPASVPPTGSVEVAQ